MYLRVPSGAQQTQTLFIHFSSALFTDSKYRNCLNFTPVTLKYFLYLLIFLCLQPPPPFLFLIPATLHLCNLAPSKLCYFYTRTGKQSVRAGGGGGVDFQVFSEHLPPTSPICRHLPRFSPHFLLQSHTQHTRAHT